VLTTDAKIDAEILMQIDTVPSAAPRDVAQKIAASDEDWRIYLPRIRQRATALYEMGQLDFIRKKKIVSPVGLKGVFRLAKPASQVPNEMVPPKGIDMGGAD